MAIAIHEEELFYGEKMNDELVSLEDREFLLKLARRCMERRVKGLAVGETQLDGLSPKLSQNGASFVTLTKGGKLRGCIGTLEAFQPLVLDVCEHAVAAALEDYRFPPVDVDEINQIEIEISYLTTPEKLEYSDSEDLLKKLHPFKDGVVLRDGSRRATFLPQVWEQLPDREDFLSHLCSKMNAVPDLWKKKHLDVSIYRVESFSEKELR